MSNDFNRSQEVAEILSLALHRNSHKGSAQFAGGCFQMFPIVKTTRIWSAFSYSIIKRLGILDEPSKTSLSYPRNSLFHLPLTSVCTVASLENVFLR